LRRLQKRFEDAFNSPKIYNMVGAIIRTGDKDNFVQWYFFGEKPSKNELDQYYRYFLGEKPSTNELDQYYKYSFLGLTHKEIIENNQEKIDEKFNIVYNALEGNNLYYDNTEEAFRLLLRLNIDEDNRQEDGTGRKFDFSIWDRNDSRGRSIEHIFPKSKVLHKEKRDEKWVIVNGKGDVLKELPSNQENKYLARASCRWFSNDGKRIQASEHSIGNLVLLYKDDNASFNDSSFEDKKALFFKMPTLDDNGRMKDKEERAIFKSRHLLHTIYKFASSSWGGTEIAINKYNTLKEFREYYGK